MALECHDSSCPRLSYTATSCQCGFTERLIRGEADVTATNRGKGLGLRYVAPQSPSTPMTLHDLSDLLVTLRERCAKL
jgi:hypothetical protein